MISFPNAKINIGLSILEKRSDGFHNIESIFYPVYCCDVLEINKCDTFQFTQTGITLDKGTNLCVKAYQLLKEVFDIANVKIHLHKAIPVGAGLGGGSSDAAFTIKTLNTLFKLQLSNVEMKEFAAQLGSDCAFFIDNKPAFATGRGEILNNIELVLNKYFIYIAYPNVFISTPEAFRGIIPSHKTKSLSELIKLPISNWKNNISNDFEESIFLKYPQIKAAKDKFYQMGAIYASMSGSGSAVYGIFENEQRECGFLECL